MWKKILLVLLLSVILAACHFEPQTTEKIPNLNPNNETGWTILHGIYVKSESGHDVLLFETENSENKYIFMTFAEECDVPDDLQSGDKIAIKIVIVQETSGVETAQVFELEKYGNFSIVVDPDILSKIKDLSHNLS